MKVGVCMHGKSLDFPNFDFSFYHIIFIDDKNNIAYSFEIPNFESEPFNNMVKDLNNIYEKNINKFHCIMTGIDILNLYEEYEQDYSFSFDNKYIYYDNSYNEERIGLNLFDIFELNYINTLPNTISTNTKGEKYFYYFTALTEVIQNEYGTLIEY